MAGTGLASPPAAGVLGAILLTASAVDRGEPQGQGIRLELGTERRIIGERMKLTPHLEFHSGDGDFIRLHTIELADDGSEGNGLLTLSSGWFGCKNYPFYFDNLEAFCRDIVVLHRDLKGSVRLAFHYESDFLQLTVDKLGHVLVAGQLNADAGTGQKLDFAFESDQTFLPQLVAGVEKIDDEIRRAKNPAR